MIAAPCTPAVHSANVAALARFEHHARSARAAYFRTHKGARLRQAYVTAQARRLEKLRAAAACAVQWFPVVVGSDVRPEDAQLVRAAVSATPAFFQRSGIARFGSNIYVFGSRETIVDEFVKVTGAARAQAETLWAQSTAVGGTSGVFVNAGAPSWRAATPAARSEIVSHELFHVVQSILDAKAWDSDTGAGRGAPWLLEGSAEYMGFHAVIDTGALTAADVDRGESDAASLAPAPLAAYSGGDAYSLGGLYPLGYCAVRQLVADHGLSALFAYFRDLGSAATWQDAFAQAFGESVDAFYGRFSGH